MREQSEMSKGRKKRSDRMVSAAELRLAAWVAAEDIPLRKTDTLVSVLKRSFGDSATAKHVEMKRTKLTGIVKNVIGSYGGDTLNLFSIIADESTDRSNTKSLVDSLRYVDSENTVREEFLALLVVDDATASEQKNLLTKYFKKVNVPIENMIGLDLDNASVNMGSENGLAA